MAHHSQAPAKNLPRSGIRNRGVGILDFSNGNSYFAQYFWVLRQTVSKANACFLPRREIVHHLEHDGRYLIIDFDSLHGGCVPEYVFQQLFDSTAQVGLHLASRMNLTPGQMEAYFLLCQSRPRTFCPTLDEYRPC
jgi:hypothetical protein